MITKGGAKLLDFGIAKASDPAVTRENASLLPTTPPGSTEPGAILGTFQYMAPEQIEGHRADARTDLFAFGCVLFEMLTGRKAFEGETHATAIAATMHAEPPPVSTLQPALPRGLARVIQKCLAKDPEDRWQSARDLHDSLQWIAEPDAIQLDQRASWLRAVRIAGVRGGIVLDSDPELEWHETLIKARGIGHTLGIVESQLEQL
jgi:serine/threonine protein kinase